MMPLFSRLREQSGGCVNVPVPLINTDTTLSRMAALCAVAEGMLKTRQ